MTYSFADVAERLMARFEGRVPLDVVVRVARESETDLYAAGAATSGTLAELVERTAEQRLAALIRAGGTGRDAAEPPDPDDPVPAPRRAPS